MDEIYTPLARASYAAAAELVWNMGLDGDQIRGLSRDAITSPRMTGAEMSGLEFDDDHAIALNMMIESARLLTSLGYTPEAMDADVATMMEKAQPGAPGDWALIISRPQDGDDPDLEVFTEDDWTEDALDAWTVELEQSGRFDDAKFIQTRLSKPFKLER